MQSRFGNNIRVTIFGGSHEPEIGCIIEGLPADIMRQNGTVFFIERKIEDLAADKRPLSGDLEKRRALYGRRLPMYMNAADHTVDNNGSVEKTAEAVIALLG